MRHLLNIDESQIIILKSSNKSQIPAVFSRI